MRASDGQKPDSVGDAGSAPQSSRDAIENVDDCRSVDDSTARTLETFRNQILDLVFALASQHARKYRRMEENGLAHDIALLAFDQITKQNSARRKVSASFQDGTDEWKRVAHMCVISARAECIKRELKYRRRHITVSIDSITVSTTCENTAIEKVDLLIHCIERLDEDRRRLIRWRLEDGLTFKEISTRLQWSVSRVYACYATTLTRLERLMNEGRADD
jgi:DNA-directed RNA polymerase specialized sigma subunit